MFDHYMLSDVPLGMTAESIDKLLIHLEECGGFNDIYIATGGRAICKVHGQVVEIIQRRLLETEVNAFITHITKDGSARTHMLQGYDIDCSYQIMGNDRKIYRYRVNISAIHSPRGNKGFEITMRSISPVPLTVADLKVEQVLLDNITPRQGLVLVVGETGSGKTTLLAAIIRMILEKKNGNNVVLTYEAPIEYVHDSYIYDRSNQVYQHEINEIGGHLKSFRAGIRNALRRNPNVILIGESRDAPTMEGMLLGANTGHLLFTTLHANSVADTISRVINEFPEDSRKARLYELVSNLRIVIVQYLAIGVDGRRTPAKEFMIFTDEIRRKLLNAEPHRIPIMVKELMDEYQGTYTNTMKADVERIFNEGKVSEEEYLKIISGL